MNKQQVVDSVETVIFSLSSWCTLTCVSLLVTGHLQ